MLEILRLLVSGVVFGTAGGLTPGPTLTLVILQTLRYGSREGLKVAIAPVLTDLPIVLGAVYLVSRVDARPVLGVLALAGASFLVYLAAESLGARPPRVESGEPDRPGSIRKGFLANLLNPHPWVFWLTIGAPTVLEAWRTTPAAAMAFIAGLYLCLVGSKILVAILVDRGRAALDRGYVWTVRLLGAVLLLFALLYVREGLRYLGVL